MVATQRPCSALRSSGNASAPLTAHISVRRSLSAHAGGQRETSASSSAAISATATASLPRSRTGRRWRKRTTQWWDGTISRTSGCSMRAIRCTAREIREMSEPNPAEVVIATRENGPYKLTGPARIVDADGHEYQLPDDGRPVALCRCGGSTTKPFCDGTHSKIGFEAAERAVRAAG